MDTAPLSGDSARFESAVDEQRRLDREAILLAEARAKIAGGLAVNAADVDAWIDGIGTDDEFHRPILTADLAAQAAVASHATGDAIVLRVFGPGQSREGHRSGSWWGAAT